MIAGHEVHRPDALDARLLAVDGEGDAEAPEDRVAQPLAAAELLEGDRAQARDEAPVRRAHLAVGGEDLVEESFGLVAGEGIVGG